MAKPENTAATEPAKPAIDVNSPEFKDAVAAETAKIMASVNEQIAPLLAKLQAASGATPSGDDKSWVQNLAMALSELSDQGQHRRRVAPEVMAARAAARDRMAQLIVKARVDKTPAIYIVRAKTHLANRLLEPMYIARDHSLHDNEIEWDSVPNEALEPVNDVAKAIFQAFKDSIGAAEWQAPEDRYGVTRGGLVVKGAAADAANRGMRVANTALSGAPIDTGDGLRVRHDSQTGRMNPVNILGDIAAPAQRMT